MIVGRARIIERVELSEQHLISIVAPAGFGKSTLARALADACGPAEHCDVADAADPAGFASAIVRAAQLLAPEREVELAHDLFLHREPGVSDAQLAGFVLDTWASVDGPGICVFDNLEAVADNPVAVDLLVRLVKAGAQRRLILCARPPLPILNSRLIPPNENLRIGIADLAFTRPEVGEMLGDGITDALVAQVMTLTQGWPVAVLLLRQFALHGQLESALNATSGASLDELRDYLVKEVLASLGPERLELLAALVAMEPLGLDGAVRATDGTATPAALHELSLRLPLVELRSDGGYAIHPLISNVLQTTAGPAIERYRLRAAESYRRAGRFRDAAQLYLEANDAVNAAACLEEIAAPFIESNADAELEGLMNHLTPELIRNSPRLWPRLALVRRGTTGIDVLAAEGLALRSNLPDLMSLEAKQISAFLIAFCTHLGNHELAEQLLGEYSPLDEADLSPGSIALLIADTLRKMLQGRTKGAIDRYRHLSPFVRNDLLRAYFILRVEVVVATMRGQFDEALIAQLRALQYARSSGKTSLIAGMAHHQAVVSWLGGDEAAVEARIDEMRRTGATLGSFNYPALAKAWDTGDSAGLGELLPRVRAFFYLMLAGKATSRERRGALLLLAHESAGEAQDLWAEFLICAASALHDPKKRELHFDAAVAFAKEIGQDALGESIGSLRAGGSGAPTLEALAQRFSSLAEGGESARTIRIDVLSRAVYRGHARLTISNRALSLLIILAVLGNVPRDALIEMLWGHDVDIETNALNMLVSRARRQLGDASLVIVSNGVYSLGADVAVDFHHVQRLVGSLSFNGPLTDSQRTALRTAHEQFKPAWLIKESSPSVDAAISGLRQRVVERLGLDAVDRNEIPDALAFAEELRSLDPTNETAYELLIRAYVRSGNSPAALSEYRAYSAHLLSELGVEPSFSVDELLRS
jgi:hypothetical protein